MENFSEQHWAHYARQVRDHDELRIPNSTVRMSLVSRAGRRPVALMALQDGHAGEGHTITGPQALTWADAADRISDRPWSSFTA
jgi:uncharacterized protein YbjT (DUF2867 family)